MSEEKKGFTVNDRRLFTPDGQPRQAAQEPPPAPRAADNAAPRPGPVQGARPRQGDAPVDLSGFLLSLAAQAAQLLEAGDLRGARSLVGILEMLQDKTEGRRTPEESDVLEGLLYELRMGYVARSGTGGA